MKSFVYKTKPEFIMANIMQTKSLMDDKIFKFELMIFKKLGLVGWLNRNGYSYKNLCDYLTKIIGTTKPITKIEVNYA